MTLMGETAGEINSLVFWYAKVFNFRGGGTLSPKLSSRASPLDHAGGSALRPPHPLHRQFLDPALLQRQRQVDPYKSMAEQSKTTCDSATDK